MGRLPFNPFLLLFKSFPKAKGLGQSQGQGQGIGDMVCLLVKFIVIPSQNI